MNLPPKIDIADGGQYLRLSFADGAAAAYHYFWLRHHCPCCVHPATKERTLDPAAVALDIRPQRIEAAGDGLRLTWPDGHQSDFAEDWLREHRYTDEAIRPLQGCDIALGYAACGDDLVGTCARYLKERGAILVRG